MIPIDYGQDEQRTRLSRAGIASLLSGAVGFPFFLYLFTHSPPTGTSNTIKLMVMILFIGLPLLGLGCGITAIGRRKRLWWLACIGIPLSIIPLAVFVFSSFAN